MNNRNNGTREPILYVAMTPKQARRVEKSISEGTVVYPHSILPKHILQCFLKANKNLKQLQEYVLWGRAPADSLTKHIDNITTALSGLYQAVIDVGNEVVSIRQKREKIVNEQRKAKDTITLKRDTEDEGDFSNGKE